MLEKIIMIVSALLMLANEMFDLGYEKVEITAAVALITTIIAAVVSRVRGEAAADRIEEKRLDLELRLLVLRSEAASQSRNARSLPRPQHDRPRGAATK